LSHAEIPTEDRLLDAAAALFWEKGYAAASTREIAAALRIRQASLYYHVASKEDLLYRICVSSLERFLAEVPAAVSQISCPLDRIRRLISAHVTALLEHRDRNATMLLELRSLAGRRRAKVVELRERYRNFVRSTLEEAQRTGEVQDAISSTHLCLALLNMLNWAALWFHPDQALSADKLAEIFGDLYLHGAASKDHRRWPRPVAISQTPIIPGNKIAKTGESGRLERLLEPAVALFSRQGYAATSTREVASLLGMQKASLYYHIESKEDLLYFICKDSLERIREDVEAALVKAQEGKAQGGLEQTRALIRAHVESMLRDQAEHATTLAEMHSLSPARKAQVVALRDRYEDLVRSVLENAQSTGALRTDIGVKYLSLGLLGLVNRVLVWYRRRGPLSPAELGQLLAAIFLGGIKV
jgi:TetR/AcrR family transcriptional regulator, cholesterol catabolism regulator